MQLNKYQGYICTSISVCNLNLFADARIKQLGKPNYLKRQDDVESS